MIIDREPKRKYLRNKRPLSLEESLSVHKSRIYDETDKGDKKKQKRENISKKWNVVDLPIIPDLYIKLKTSCAIINDEPKSVANRIFEYAKAMSAVGFYEDDKAAATLRIDQMELCIQLFDDSNNSQNIIVVEIRRKNGSSISFHKAARAILNAAKGSMSVVSTPLFGPPSPAKLPQKKKNVNETVVSTIETIDSLLRKDRVDANLLGMESLLHLTTRGTSSDVMTQFAANVVMNCKDYVIRDKVFSLITNSNLATDTNVLDKTFHGKMRNRALSLLSNSLEVISNKSKSSLESKLSTEEWTENGGIISILVDELKNAETNPQEAYLAAKCLKIIIETSNDLRSHAIQLEALNVLKYSQRVGHCTHNLLGYISDDILNSLTNGRTTCKVYA